VGTKEPVIPKRESTITAIKEKATISELNSSIASDANYISHGKNIYETKCIRCHNVHPVANYTEQRWDGILTVMLPKARLNETEIQQLAAYIKANARK
jgi:mono/diheme cytochrome c family protein